MLEKYAVQLGGGRSQRFGLDDAVVIKGNHTAVAGGVSEAVRKAKEALGHLHKIEVRVANERELRDALKHDADVVLFEDLEVAELTRLVAVARELSSIVKVEYSGNITLENVRTFAEAGADMISIAALTNSARAMNVSFQMQPF